MPSGNIRVTAIRTEEKPSAASVPISATKALDLVRFVALSTSVHADAVQTAAEATQSALMQMRSEEETLNYLDGRLQTLLKEQRRLRGVRDAIARSQEGRRQTDVLLREQQRRLEEETERARGPKGKRMQYSRGGDASHTASTRDNSIAETEDAAVRTAKAEALSAVDAEVERTRNLVAETNRLSIRAKLLELELLKKTTREVDVRSLLKDTVLPFSFPQEVEALWGSPEDDAFDAPSSSAETSDKPNENKRRGSDASSPAPARRRRFSTTGSTKQIPGAKHWETAGKLENVVDHTNIDLLLARATQRFTGRYKDALALLSQTAMDKDCRPQQTFGSLLYADYLDAANGNPDAAAVEELQAFGKNTLADHYATKCRQAILDERIAPCCLDANEDGITLEAPSSVLSSFDFCALPTNWPATNALTALPEDALLPPARHIVTQRFSFSDVGEMRQLERLRVDIQRQLVKDLVDESTLLDAMFAIRQGNGGSQPASAPPTNKERFVTETRLAVMGAAADGKSHAWPTVISSAGDDW